MAAKKQSIPSPSKAVPDINTIQEEAFERGVQFGRSTPWPVSPCEDCNAHVRNGTLMHETSCRWVTLTSDAGPECSNCGGHPSGCAYCRRPGSAQASAPDETEPMYDDDLPPYEEDELDGGKKPT